MLVQGPAQGPAAPATKRRGRSTESPLVTLPWAIWGHRALQAGLDETSRHGCVVTCIGGSLGNSKAESTPKQACAFHGDAIGILGHGISSITLGARI